MPSPCSNDFRFKIVEAVRQGNSCRQVAARFGVSPSWVIELMQRYRATGDVSPAQFGGVQEVGIAGAGAETPRVDRGGPGLDDRGSRCTLGEGWDQDEPCGDLSISAEARPDAKEKDGPGSRAISRGYRQGPRRLARPAEESESRAVDIRRRDLGFDDHGATLRASATRATGQCCRSTRQGLRALSLPEMG